MNEEYDSYITGMKKRIIEKRLRETAKQFDVLSVMGPFIIYGGKDKFPAKNVSVLPWNSLSVYYKRLL